MIRSFNGRIPTVPSSCYIDPSAQVIGDVTLGEDVSVWMNAVIRGDVHSIRIGARSNVQDCVVLHGMRHLHPVSIGEMVTLGHNATLHGCRIDDTVLVGIGAIVLNGAHIGEGSILAAGTVVPEQTIIPPRSLVAGVPGRIRRSLEAAEIDGIAQYARNYLGYAAAYRAEALRVGELDAAERA